MFEQLFRVFCVVESKALASQCFCLPWAGNSERCRLLPWFGNWLSSIFMFRSLAKAPFFLIIAPYLHRHQYNLFLFSFFGLVFLYLLFLVFCPLTLRRVHTCQQVLATSFTSHHLLSFQKACSHSTASAFGGCANIQASFFVEIEFHIITFF